MKLTAFSMDVKMYCFLYVNYHCSTVTTKLTAFYHLILQVDNKLSLLIRFAELNVVV
jgi:hypothetical protein